jgi:hypothetical protein
VTSCGCADIRGKVDHFKLGNFSKRPIRVAITNLQYSPPPHFLVPSHRLFCDNLSFYLDHPVCFELLTPRQIRVHLADGRTNFAMLSAGDFAQIADSPDYEMLAVPVHKSGKTSRQGLVVVSAESPIQSLANLKGSILYLIPQEDLINGAGLGLLLEAGVVEKGTEGKPVGIEIRKCNSAESLVERVCKDPKSGGIIPAAAYEKWRESTERLIIPQPSRSQVRIISKTVLIPNGPFIASTHNPPELTEKVHTYLLKEVSKWQPILSPMGYTGFAKPRAKGDYKPFFDVYDKVRELNITQPVFILPLQR